MDDAPAAAEAELEVVGEPEPGAADRVEIVVGGGDDGRARQAADKRCQPREEGRGVSPDREGRDPMPRQRVVAARNAVGTPGAGTELRGRRFGCRPVGFSGWLFHFILQFHRAAAAAASAGRSAAPTDGVPSRRWRRSGSGIPRGA